MRKIRILDPRLEVSFRAHVQDIASYSNITQRNIFVYYELSIRSCTERETKRTAKIGYRVVC